MNRPDAAGLVAVIALAAFAATAVAADPLPSWNGGPTRSAIVGFVERVTKEGEPDFVPPADRIAVFDNDGTLWCEQPVYVQAVFAIDRIKALAPAHPEWNQKQPFKGVIEGDLKSALAGGERSAVELMMASHSGLTTEEFESVVERWIADARHPKYKRPYTDLVYQPMVECLAYLRAATLRPENGAFDTAAYKDLEAREKGFFQAQIESPAMFRRTPEAGSLYWLGTRDGTGAYLDGGKSYKLPVPQPVPAKLFWSVTVYDAETRSQIQTDTNRAALRSLFELKGIVGEKPADLHFGPNAPTGKARRWIKTTPGKGWFVFFRIYDDGAELPDALRGRRLQLAVGGADPRRRRCASWEGVHPVVPSEPR